MKRCLIAIVAMLVALTAVLPADAGWRWCYRDPVVRLNGTEVQVLVAIPEQYQSAVNGPIQVEVEAPQVVTKEVVSTDDGFNGFGEDVRFAESDKNVLPPAKFQTEVLVIIPLEPGTDPFQVVVTVTPSGGKERSVHGKSDGASVTLMVDSSGS